MNSRQTKWFPLSVSTLTNKKVLWGAAAAGVAILTASAFSGLMEPAAPVQTGGKPVVSAAAIGTSAPVITLEAYNGDFFTIQKPAGWEIVTAGQGPTLSVWMRDPKEPTRQAFFFGAVGPFYLSQQQKFIDNQYMATGGYPIQWADMPVVSPATASNFLTNWNTVASSRIAQGFMAERPFFKNLTIISTQSISSQFGGNTELVRALFKQDGKVVEGLFTATILETVPFMNGPGGHQAYALMFSGVTTPKSEFTEVQDELVRALGSFNLSQQYVQTYMASSREAFAGVMRAGQTLRETSDIITKGWNERQKTYDILSEKRSDAMLGKERVYDPHSGEVYTFSNGWFQHYDANRGKYNKPELQLIPDNDYKTWNSPTLNGPNHVYMQ